MFLGRSSFIAQNLASSGTIGSHHLWAQAVQSDAYEWSNFLPFYKKSVQFTPPKYDKIGSDGLQYKYDASAFENDGGPVQASYPNYYPPVSDGLVSAFEDFGLQEIEGLNSGQLIGYAACTASIDPVTATRSSSESAFGQAMIANTTAVIYQSTLAKRILFNNMKQAIGVQVETADVPYSLFASKEVVISAGAVNLPDTALACNAD